MEVQNSGAASCGVATGVPDERDAVVPTSLGEIVPYKPDQSLVDQFADLAAWAPNQVQFAKPSDGDRSSGRLFTKTYKVKNGLLQKLHRNFPSDVVPMALTAHDLISAVECLKRAEADDGGYCMLLGALNTRDERVLDRLKRRRHVSRTKKELKKRDGTLQLSCFVEVDRHLVAIDFDPTNAQHAWCKSAGLDVYADPDGAVRACVKQFLPEELQRCAFAYQLSAGAGLSEDKIAGGYVRDPSKIKFHVFLWLKTPRPPCVVKAGVQARDRENIAADFGDIRSARSGQSSGGLDLALYQGVQPHFISTRFEGCDDPLAGKRWGIIAGDEIDLDEISYIDERLEGSQRVRDSIKAIESRCGQQVRRATTELNGKSVTAKAMPHGWRERLSLMAPANVNDIIKATTWALARDLEAQHGIDGANSENLKRAYLDEIFAQVLKTPGNRDPR
jgi:hypothetical protein